MSGNWTVNVTHYSSLCVGIANSLFALIALIENCLILASFIINKQLCVSSNFFIASLAIVDIFMCLLPMNLFSIQQIFRRWPFWDFICDLWMCIDYSACSASQNTVLLITIDRYCSTKMPVAYRNWKTNRKVFMMISLAWIFPVALFSLLTFWYPRAVDKFDWQRADPTGKNCFAKFSIDPILNGLLVSINFWMVTLIIVGLYIAILRTAYSLNNRVISRHLGRKKMIKFCQTPDCLCPSYSCAQPSNHEVYETHQPHAASSFSSHKEDKILNVNVASIDQLNIYSCVPNGLPCRLLTPKQSKKSKYEAGSASLTEKSKCGHEFATVLQNQEALSCSCIGYSQNSKLVMLRKKCYIKLHQNARLLPKRIYDRQAISKSGMHVGNAFEAKSDKGRRFSQMSCENLRLTQVFSQNNSNLVQRNRSQNNRCTDLVSSLPRSLDSHRFSTRHHLHEECTTVKTPASSFAGHENTNSCSSNICPIRLPSSHFNSSLHDHHNRLRKRLCNRAFKALLSIALILGAYLICWTPYHVVSLLTSFHCPKIQTLCVTSPLYTFVYWLCYANSFLNPFCYAACNRNIRNTLFSIISGKK